MKDDQKIQGALVLIECFKNVDPDKSDSSNQEMSSSEPSSTAVWQTQRDTLRGSNEPPSFSSGFLQGSTGVEVHGGRFNQMYGHQTNITIQYLNGTYVLQQVPMYDVDEPF